MNISELALAGTSIWLDDLSRAKITGTDAHSLPHRISNDGVVGVTTNPSIFSAAINGASEYAADIAAMKGQGIDAVLRKLTTDDVRAACDLFADIYRQTSGANGRVSIEVDPRLAHDMHATVTEAKALFRTIDRPNVMIKVPATKAGLPAITALIASGISVNVTLIFSIQRYAEVIDAFITGIEERAAAGLSVKEVHSVASFFISRIDAAVDAQLKVKNIDSLLGKAAIANAHLAYELFEITSASDRWQVLARQGANMQRPLWASTGVKDPAYDDTRYVLELVAPHTVNTVPQATLDAVIDHGVFQGNTISGRYGQARADLAALAAAGVSLAQVTTDLEIDGVKKFADAWTALLENVGKAVKS